MPGHGGVRLGGRQADPIGGHDIGAARGWAGELDAGERRIALGLGPHPANQQPDRLPQIGEHLLIRRVIGRALDDGVEGAERLGGPVERLQRVDQDQQRCDLRGAGLGRAVGEPRSLCGACGIRRGALELGPGQLQPEVARAVAGREPQLEGRRCRVPVVTGSSGSSALLGLLLQLRGQAGRVQLRQRIAIGLAVSLEAGRVVVVGPCRSCCQQQEEQEPAHRGLLVGRSHHRDRPNTFSTQKVTKLIIKNEISEFRTARCGWSATLNGPHYRRGCQ